MTEGKCFTFALLLKPPLYHQIYKRQSINKGIGSQNFMQTLVLR